MDSVDSLPQTSRGTGRSARPALLARAQLNRGEREQDESVPKPGLHSGHAQDEAGRVCSRHVVFSFFLGNILVQGVGTTSTFLFSKQPTASVTSCESQRKPLAHVSAFGETELCLLYLHNGRPGYAEQVITLRYNINGCPIVVQRLSNGNGGHKVTASIVTHRQSKCWTTLIHNRAGIRNGFHYLRTEKVARK